MVAKASELMSLSSPLPSSDFHRASMRVVGKVSSVHTALTRASEMKTETKRVVEYCLGILCILAGLIGFLLHSNSYLGVFVFSTGLGLMGRRSLLEYIKEIV